MDIHIGDFLSIGVIYIVGSLSLDLLDGKLSRGSGKYSGIRRSDDPTAFWTMTCVKTSFAMLIVYIVPKLPTFERHLNPPGQVTANLR